MSNPDSNLHYMNLPGAALFEQAQVWQAHVLGAICFSAGPTDPDWQAAMPFLPVVMKPLATSAALCEVWYSHTDLNQGHYKDINYRCNEAVIFGTVALAEADFFGDAPLRLATEAAYRQIGALLDSLNYPHVFRYWNYMADINGKQDNIERYQQFNYGRQNAFLAQGRAVVGNLPAACALGMPAGRLSIAFLAGRVAPIAIENPRQLSAFSYPPIYGPRSPAFSRASLVSLTDREWLFISGTASIVGHSSLHSGDVLAQTRETIANIVAILAEANRLAQHTQFDLPDLQFNVYLRHAHDLAMVRAELALIVGSDISAVYLEADVCRQELLVEIEAISGNIQRPIMNRDR